MRGGAALHGRKGGGAMPRGKRAYRVLLWAVLAALLALAAFAGWRLWRVYGDAARAAQLAREMQQTAVPAAGESAAGTDGAEMPAHACPVDFETLRRDYPAVTAWLTGCGGDIDTPVAQGADNIYYLDHLPDGTRNMLGQQRVLFRRPVFYFRPSYGHGRRCVRTAAAVSEAGIL